MHGQQNLKNGILPLNWPSGNKLISSEDVLEVGLRIGSNGDVPLRRNKIFHLKYEKKNTGREICFSAFQ